MLTASVCALPFAASAQAPAPQGAPEPAPAAAPDTQPALTEEQISQLVAPIALYPDNLLAQVLTASTYPLEVVMAARWAKDNASVKGEALDAAMQKQNWDPSVKGLTAVPQVLEMMNEQLDWTQQLGDAYLAQPDDITDAVQKLRAKAEASGNLKSSKELKVTSNPAPAAPAAGEYAGPYIAIEPAEPDVIYVPVYDPVVVYGGWAYPAYRPFYWRPRNWAYVGVFGFGSAFVVRSALWSRYDWRHRRIYIDVNRYNRFNRTRLVGTGVVQWRHDPRHRGAVGYKNPAVKAHFSSGKPGVVGVPKRAIPARATVAPRAGTGPVRLVPSGPTGAPKVVPVTKPKPKAVVTPKPAVKPKATTAPKVTVTPKPKAVGAPKAAPKPALKPAPKAAPKPAPKPAANPVVKKKKNQP